MDIESDVASAPRAIESPAAVSTIRATVRIEKDPWRSERMRQLRAARTCYDHLAGVLGVQFHNSLLQLGYLEAREPRDYALTLKGLEWTSSLGLSPDALRTRSPCARGCLDWSERQPHLAGRLAAHLLDRFFKDGWIKRIRDTRAVRITERGVRELETHYGIVLDTQQ